MPTLKLSINVETSCPANGTGTGIMAAIIATATANPPHSKVSMTTMLRIRSNSTACSLPATPALEPMNVGEEISRAART